MSGGFVFKSPKDMIVDFFFFFLETNVRNIEVAYVLLVGSEPTTFMVYG